MIPQPVDEGLIPVGDETPATADTDIGTGAPDQDLGVIQPGVGGLRGVGGLDRPGTLVERRYRVEAVNFRCYSETGYDDLGSDEIAIVISDVTINNKPDNWIYYKFEDVDAGKTRSFPSNQRCILPKNVPHDNYLAAFEGDVWPCSETGVPGPFSFTVSMRELDSGPYFAALVDGYRIGSRTLTFTPEELEAAMPNVYDTYYETIRLGPCHDERGCVISPGLPEPADYSFTYGLTRLPDYVPEPAVSPGS